MKQLFYIVICVCSLTTALYSQCIGTEGQIRWHAWTDLQGYDIGEIYVDDTYPNGPNVVKVINSISSPRNYDDMFGSVMKGFLKVGQTGPVSFNLTGDDFTRFYLSSDTNAANLVERASIDGWTDVTEHDKYPSQNSIPITLVANTWYYFEIHNRDGGGGDHANLYWKNNFVSNTEWTIISSQYIADTCNDTCPTAGTPCNDFNSNTTDDRHDGHCNCVGKANTGNSCIGERGNLQAYAFDENTGNLSDLYTDPDYPTMPDRLSIYDAGLSPVWSEYDSNYGILIQGYLTVPVSGSYQFNITGINNVKFLLSSNADPANLGMIEIESPWGTNSLDHDEPGFEGSQTSQLVNLQANQYYYFEAHQVALNWGHRFDVYWKGAHYPDNNWHKIAPIYLYDYACELACLPAGQACNDGNIYTANDQIVNCDCIGTPCGAASGVACDDPAAAYTNFDYCSASTMLDNRVDDTWLSCNAGTNPYLSSRSGYHWIHYDLGNEYNVEGTHVWNYNVSGQTNRGFQSVAVDYSLDGVSWFELGTYTWSLASGNSGYVGFSGPNFNGEVARYIMFISLDSPSSCRGISKISFEVSECPLQGESCSDGISSTYNDHYNRTCECVGYTQEQLNCQVDTLYINQDAVGDVTYHALQSLMSEGNVLTGSDVNYKAGREIILSAGFKVNLGTQFNAEIDNCQVAFVAVEVQLKENENLFSKKRPEERLDVFSVEGRDEQTIRFYLPEPTLVTLDILDQSGNLIYRIAKHDYKDFGDKYKRVQTKKLDQGIYLIRLTTNKNQYTKKMTVLNNL